MGFVIQDSYTKGLIGTLQEEVLSALSEAANRVRSRQADAAVTRWFGDTSDATRNHIQRSLSRMRTILNCEQIQLGFTSLKKVTAGGATSLVRGGSNAAAQRSTSGLRPLNSTLPSYAGAGFHQSNMWLDEGFNRLPKYLPLAGGAIDSSGWNQSKFNTIVHELSHLLLGTVDCVDGAGNTQYGAQRAEALALHGITYAHYNPPFAALHNAENWGIFVEAAGRNKGT
ncbi:hypothetical protein [Microbulbifer hainanensis]|uniref:hypothetical protein n=1 Tax=Microbulbifer hainanensis TaxID=2735675 RepID=UPI0018679CA5|nr:hypothetical protein [Microbulbifer hainanensis]